VSYGAPPEASWTGWSATCPGRVRSSRPAADRVELRGWAGSLKRHGEWMVPTRLALVRRLGSIELDLTKARFAGPVVVIELDMKFGSLDIRLPDGASASVDDVEVLCGQRETTAAKTHPRRAGPPCRADRSRWSAARWSSGVPGGSLLRRPQV